ncbi:MAG: DMT family transporter [Wenzhouxiangellaceae bacterium]|nr:DMT family transporter [Wenzhouxiangellaceae bacterium]
MAISTGGSADAHASMRSIRHSAWLVTAGAVMISFAAVFVRLADVAATTSAFYRLAFGTLTLALIVLIRPRLGEGLRHGWIGSTIVALFFTADLWLWHRSILFIGPGLSTLLANFQVFVLAAIGVLWLREAFSLRFGGAIVLAMLGLWLLFGREWASLSGDYRLGIAFGLATALAYSGYLLSLRGVQMPGTRLRPEGRLLQVSLLSALMMAGLNLFEGHGFAIPDRGSLAALVALGVICQVLGWLAISRGMPGLPASLIGLLLLLQPVLSMTWDVALFNLALSLPQTVGAVLALVAIYLGLRVRSARPG